MKSEFVLGVLGLLIVTSTVVGGMVLAGICHSLFTPNIEIFYMVWLWIGLIPFWWITARTMPEGMPHPAPTYLSFLPFLLVGGLLIDAIGATWWIVPILGAVGFAHFSILEHIRRHPNAGLTDSRR